MSPRRSSRSRTTQQPPPSVTAAPSTSSSSVSSSRTDRATRVNHKQSSPQKSSTPHSLSSEEVDETIEATVEPPQTRRRTRGQDNDDDDAAQLDDDLDDEMNEEEEVTRCLCGQQEYPGPPSETGKSREGQPSLLADSDNQNEEAGGLFIQCDICKVWQHGGCVGIMDEAASPEEYYCEECRKDLHKLMISSKGQKYSRYLPVYELSHGKSARKSSVPKDADSKNTRDKDRNARASAESFSKRRSTMNSRAAYDEDEVLRKVIEQSKHEGGATQSENGNRKKRSRDDSEEIKQEPKRQRTSSRSPSNSPVLESEEDNLKTAAAKQKPRGAAARSQREKEQRDKERERERVEAANRRKGRAERRKADGIAPVPAPRKSGRPPQRPRGKLGRNQYSRDAPTPATNGASPAGNNDIPNSPQPSATNGTGNGHESSDGTAGHKPAKAKNWRLEKLSWNEIRRPAGAMQNYIAQRQVEMAGEKSASAPPVQSPAAVNGEKTKENAKADGDDLEVFKELSTLQMMDDLSRELVHWQRMIAEQNEK
ncbi:hypothetical protein K491DRAFT_726122 [Lophiostoma macrostomum CBS 122681]|uniref:Zinc finger PHD-type domain-containing protein n=1 Tax=Lophiostoma macrostomum CBS 122681 TaxID=1314788 RepID=A0A6A6TLH9_9PLEO|nr:hypothetical protein K491DRAFT_726122 [Lophiostoma macrostomum CBS 122681]